ncbi:MAG: ATP-binding protein [Verrucomicrobiales bacterium]
MIKFRDITLRRKQTLIIMLTSSVALLVACASFVMHDVFTFRGKLIESLSVLAGIIGENCAAAIEFNDATAANQTLATLRGAPNIVGAFVFARTGEPFASYKLEGVEVPPTRDPSLTSRHEFTSTFIRLNRPIIHKGEALGSIELVANLQVSQDRLWSYVGIAFLVLIFSLLAAYGLSNGLQKLVSEPILQLAQVARTVAHEKNYSVRATKLSNDELGELVDGFNEMLAQIQTRDTALQKARDNLEDRVEERTRELEVIHNQLVDASRRGGMAEIASNVLHNVGNVLNSVNVSTGLIAERVRKSRVSSLAKVVALLRQHEKDLGHFITQDERGKHLLVFLAQLSEHLISEQTGSLGELESLQQNVEHIKEIVAMQQTYATFGGLKEMMNLLSLVDDSIRMNERGLILNQIQIVREYDEVPPMNLEKHKILQILVNLVRNAKHACQASDNPNKKITVRVVNKGGSALISVIDNGVGISRENMTRIFNHGFTTKKDGHGFGLHSGALAAKEMGGALTVHSDGPGQGATFTLELPDLAANG